MKKKKDLSTDTAAIMNLLDSRSIMGCPRDMSTIQYTRSVYMRALFGPIFPRKRLLWEKKIVVPCLDVIMISLFPKNIRRSSRFAQKASVNTERVPPGHPIILLKSNKFNMTASETRRTNNLAYLTSSGINVRVISSSFFRFSVSLNNFSKTTKAINSRNFESFLERAHRTTP